MAEQPARDFASLTLAEWYAAISAALTAHDVQAVGALVRVMALYHPHEAESIRQTLLLGVRIATADDEPNTLPLHRTAANVGIVCSTCDGGGCPDCTDPA